MKTNDEIMDILDRLKRENNLSISEIARRVGMAKSAVSKYFTRQRKFPLNRMEDFANAFNVSTDYILEYGKRHSYSEEIANIPVIQSITNDSTIIAEASPKTYYPTTSFGLPKGQLFYFKMNDISMEPMIPKEAIVLIKEQNNVDDEEIAAVTLNDDPTLFLRKIRKQDDFILLLAENPDYAPIIVTKEENMKVIGKAIRVSYDI
ncbi:hypothetical protein TEHAL1_01100 [Tetragenococcus halophilus]|uniref:LexA family protein n=1 Tax=Tetragenococcus halophilus TaxID=51669 RepID=UPI00256C6832|nr:XRE family transcriptional regulator [Tetragenococcus halophilus]GMG62636.1 hypothetical protein TEHAL1_01100 [Tetragenococcus halophilus]